MQTWWTEFLRQTWQILLDSSVYILFGFLVASLLHVWMQRSRIADTLRGMGTRSVLAATLVGLPLPLCSCSVLPAAISMRRRGASKGATLAFIISTPEAGLEASLFLTYGLLGGYMVLARLVAGMSIAVVAGVVENLVARRWPEPEVPPASVPPECCPTDPLCETEHDHAHDHEPTGFAHGFRHAFVNIFDDIVGWMVLSFFVAAAINVFIPNNVLLGMLGNPWVAMLVLLAVGIPLYVCAEASTPIAAAFILKGVSPGAALVFLLAGPATNFGSIAVLTRELGRRTVAVYLAVICIMSIAFGAIFHALDQRYDLVRATGGAVDDWIPIQVKQAAALVFIALAIVSFFRLHGPAWLLTSANRVLPFQLSPRAASALLAILLLAAYGMSGFATVGPDEVGLVTRFGRVVDSSAKPGVYWVWPYPIGRLDRVNVSRVQRTLLGEGTIGSDGNPTIDESEAWAWLGDENVASLKYAVHWSIDPARMRDYKYGLGDEPRSSPSAPPRQQTLKNRQQQTASQNEPVREDERLIRAAALAACREVLSTWTIDTIYTTGRKEAEAAIQKRLAEHCADVGSGIAIESFRFLDVHAPVEVHDAFRDLASAEEYKATQIDRAKADEARRIPLAHGRAALQEADARAYAVQTVTAANSEAQAYSAILVAAQENPRVTRTRLYLEALDQVLPKLRLYLQLDDAPDRPLDLYFTEGRQQLPPAPE